MKHTSKKINSLLREYYQIASEILELNQSFWDSMHCDIDGYYYDKADGIDIDLEALEEQVSAAKLLLDALKKLNYIYG